MQGRLIWLEAAEFRIVRSEQALAEAIVKLLVHVPSRSQCRGCPQRCSPIWDAKYLHPAHTATTPSVSTHERSSALG